MPRLSRRTALTAAFAVALATSLAACSSSKNADDSNTAAQDAAATEAGTATGGGSDSGGTVPDGYTAVKVPGTNMSFPVPSDWETLTSDDAERVNAFVQSTGQDADTVKLKLAQYAAISIASADSDATEEIDVQTDTTVTKLRTEEEVSATLEESGLEFDDFSISTETTSTGAEARTMSYSLDLSGTRQHSAIINTLNPDGNGIIIFSISSTASAERTQELTDAILGSI